MVKEVEQDGFITRDEDLKEKPMIIVRKSMVLIKDMALPYSCDRCRLKDNTHNECRVSWKRVGTYGIGYTHKKPKWCPLTEVTPYGPEGTFYKEK